MIYGAAPGSNDLQRGAGEQSPNETSVICLINRKKNLRMRYLNEFENEIPECFGE